MFYALSENLKFFKDKINIFIALAPVVRIDNCSSGLINKMRNIAIIIFMCNLRIQGIVEFVLKLEHV